MPTPDAVVNFRSFAFSYVTPESAPSRGGRTSCMAYATHSEGSRFTDVPIPVSGDGPIASLAKRCVRRRLPHARHESGLSNTSALNTPWVPARRLYLSAMPTNDGL
jgi:hypothetical protein